MKESIEGTTLMQIVMVFLFIFTAVICVSINYSNAYKAKNDIVKYIERHGIEAAKEDEFLETIKNNGYYDYGDCDSGYTGVSDDTTKGYLFCYKEFKNGSSDELSDSSHYYNIVAFYHVNLPFINQINFKVKGSTKTLY